MRSVAVVLVLAVVLSASACRGRFHGPATPHAADTRWQRRLEALARRDLSCRAVRLVALNEAVWQVDGCGHLLEYEMLCAGRHCSWHRIEPAALRASRDFGCPLSSLAATVPSATRRDFSGCGRAATYVLGCGASHCEWQSYAAAGAAATGPYAATAAAPPGYGAAPATAPPATAPLPAGDGSLDDIVIPPPPGSTASTAPAAEPPQSITAIPPSGDTAPAPPPAATPPATTPPSDGSTDDLVIPPPPP